MASPRFRAAAAPHFFGNRRRRQTFYEEKETMKMIEIRNIAKAKGVSSIGKAKEALVRAIQVAEKNRDCFNRGQSETCGQAACAWRSDCK
jgi:hypothetical protein